MTTVTIAGKEWWTGVEARANMGMTSWQFAKFVKLHGDQITIQKYPGCRMRFLASDCERLAARSIRPATATK